MMLIIVLIPFLRLAIGGHTVAFKDALDVYTYMLSSILPLAFPIIILIFGVSRLNSQLAHRYLAYTRTRQDIRQALARQYLYNAMQVGLSLFLAVALSAVFAFGVNPRLSLVRYYVDPTYGREASGANTFSFLLASGWPTYALGYGLYVGLVGAVWASGAFSLLLLMHNRYLALSVPFLVYHLGNFAAGVTGFARFSPISATFPFNVTNFPLWTASVPLGVVGVATAFLAVVCYRTLHRLDALA